MCVKDRKSWLFPADVLQGKCSNLEEWITSDLSAPKDLNRRDSSGQNAHSQTLTSENVVIGNELNYSSDNFNDGTSSKYYETYDITPDDITPENCDNYDNYYDDDIIKNDEIDSQCRIPCYYDEAIMYGPIL
jgi:hypothetical protein